VSIAKDYSSGYRQQKQTVAVRFPIESSVVSKADTSVSGFLKSREWIDILDIKDAMVRLPAVILKQRVIVGTEIFRETFG
jgi:hypothetical protein